MAEIENLPHRSGFVTTQHRGVIAMIVNTTTTRIKSLIAKANDKVHNSHVRETELLPPTSSETQEHHTSETLKPEHFNPLLAGIDRVESTYDKMGDVLKAADESIDQLLTLPSEPATTSMEVKS